jgi:DNA-binding MarR family transcriptional regulator
MTPRGTGDSPEDLVVRAFIDFRRVVLRDSMRQSIKFMHGSNVSFGAIAALMTLRERGDQTISSLASEIGLSLAATSQLVERLVQDDFVKRTESPEDRRRKLVALAPKGQAFLTRMEGSYTAAAKALSGVPASTLKRLEGAFREVLRHFEPTTTG